MTKIPGLLYRFLKIASRIAIKIYCRKIVLNKPGLIKEKGPLLLASNHPNSFLDSVILDTLFEEPVWSLARGDVFKKPFYINLLGKLRILPVYRTSEGPENVPENYKTFEACQEIFRHNGVVTIFSEGKCINEWHLRQLKKGTARLAFKAWEENIPLKVLPVGINYNSFHLFGKNIFINFGDMIRRDDMNPRDPDGLRHQAFNQRLEQELSRLVFEIPKDDHTLKTEKLSVPVPTVKKIVLAIPAFLGWVIHLPLFLPVKKYTRARTQDNDHYDSVLLGILLVAYPLFLALLITILFLVLHSWWVLPGIFFLPVSAWCYVQLKPQLDSW